jgi:hypothetical protein
MKTKSMPPAPEKPAAQESNHHSATERPPSALARRLLSLAGRTVDRRAPDDPHAAELLERGREFDSPVEMRPGEPHRCHRNAATLWAEEMGGLGLVTGYGLAGDRWVQHSWVVGGGKILETTVRFRRYFGVLLTEDEATQFWYVNYLDPRYAAQLDQTPGDEAASARFYHYLFESYPGPMGVMARVGEAASKAAQAAA